MLTPRPVATTTTVEHYKDAAERHLHVCAILVKQLDFPQNFRDTNKYHNILAELYYLSGYIVECAINYKYLTSVGFLDSEDYNDRGRWTPNIPGAHVNNDPVRLKGHFRFTTPRSITSSENILGQLPTMMLPPYLQSLGNVLPITLTGNEIIQKIMQQYWDPSIRYAYESTGLTFSAPTSVDDIKIYYKAAKDLFYNLI